MEHFLGKEEVIGSIPIVGFGLLLFWQVLSFYFKIYCDSNRGEWIALIIEVVGVMRVIVHFACSDCNRKNYSGTKNKKTTTQRLEFNKYCRFCGRHTPHKETK